MAKRKRTTRAAAADVIASAAKEPKSTAPAKAIRRNLLSTGSTVVNLQFSGNPFGGLLKGKYYFIVGDSTAGKTFFSMSCFAEATQNRHFADYRFIYDNGEDGCLMDMDRLFGSAVADRIEPPRLDSDDSPLYSDTIEDFFYNVDDALKDDRPFIYVLDSMDSLSSDAEHKKFNEQKEASRTNKETAGTMMDGKAKKNSSGMRRLVRRLSRSGSILIVVSQTRDDVKSKYGGKTRSGGHALTFYATVEIWLSVREKLTRTVRGRKRQIGVKVRLQTVKNRITGKLYNMYSDIYPSYGIDDIGACIDYLLDESWWEKKKESIVAKGLGVIMSRPKLIKHIEQKDLHKKLQAIVGKCWATIEDACDQKRQSKYD